MPSPAAVHRSAPARSVARVVVALLAAALLVTAPALREGRTAHAATLPSRVLPSTGGGAEVTLAPGAVRAAAGPTGTPMAEVDVALGGDAPGDVVVDLAVATPEVAPDGVVRAGVPAPAASVTRGARLRPGELLRATVRPGDRPTVVVATVTPAGGGDPVELAGLVLPAAEPTTPTVQLARQDGRVEATVRADVAQLVTVELSGRRRTTHPDRLVLPDSPLVLEVEAAPWPAPTTLAVTTESGATVRADTGRTALAALAGVLVLLAAGGLGLGLRHRRARAA